MAIKEHVTEETVVQRTKRTVVTCDGCGASAPRGEWINGGYYEHDEVELASRHETHYPEGGSMSGVAYDCCPKCFKEKVEPALQALGFKPRETSRDY